MLVRNLTLADAAVIARIHVQTWHETYPGMMPPEMLARMTFEAMLPIWEKELGEPKPGLHFLGAVSAEGDLLGWGMVGPARESGLKGLELWALNVPQIAQKKGVGRAILSEAIRRVLNTGETAMHLWVVDQNTNAIDFYKRLGGQPTQHEKLGRGVREVAMIWDPLAPLP